MPIPIILALGHKRRVGKDTVARLIMTHLRLNHVKLRVERRSFATQLKQVAYDLYSWGGLQPEAYYENHPLHKETILPAIGKSPRDIWISIGMAARSIYSETWIKLAIKAISPDVDMVLFTDLRFENEAVAIKAAGGKCFRVIRPSEALHFDPADTGLDKWLGWDDTLINDSGIKELNIKAVNLIESLL